MKFAFAMPHLMRLKATLQGWEAAVTGADQTRLARFADELGYDMIAIPEHFLIPNAHLDLSGPHYFHAAAAQGYMAGATSRIRINSSIAILPLQHPAITAKALATIDWLSSGRTIATFGVGWLKEEFDLLGVDFSQRGRMADEYLEAMIALWTQESPSFEGRYVSFRDCAFEPKPFTKPHLPIWMGGDADAALRRCARFATGWWPFLTRPEAIPERIDFISSQPEWRGGDLEVMYGLGTTRIGEGHAVLDDPNVRPGMGLHEMVDRIGWFADLGVTMTGVPIPPVSDIEAYLDYSRWVIEEVKPRCGGSAAG